MANNAAAATAMKLLREVERQARKTMREEGESQQVSKFRVRIHIKQDKVGKVSIGGSVATNLPTEPVAGEVGGDWEMTNEVGVVGFVEYEKTVTMTG